LPANHSRKENSRKRCTGFCNDIGEFGEGTEKKRGEGTGAPAGRRKRGSLSGARGRLPQKFSHTPKNMRGDKGRS